MRKMLLVGMCFLSAAQLCGQAAKTPFDAFRDSVIDRQFALRNFSGKTKVKVAWEGTLFALDAPGWQTFGMLKVRSVTEKGEQIRLDCERHVLGLIGLNHLAPYPVVDSVQISIDLEAGIPRNFCRSCGTRFFSRRLKMPWLQSQSRCGKWSRRAIIKAPRMQTA